MAPRARRVEVFEGEEEETPAPTRTQRSRRNDTSDEDEDDADVDRADGQEDSGSGSLEQLAKGLVRYALSCEYSRKPIKRQDINEKVLGSHTRLFKEVYSTANTHLMEVFGMQMVELPRTDRVTTRQKRAAVASDSQSKASNIWILQTILPEEYRIPEIIGPSRPIEEGLINREDSYVGLYTMVIALITISGGIIPEGKLHRALVRMNADQTTPVGSKDQTLAAMVTNGYIVKIKESSGDGESIEYIVGPRGHVEVGREGLAEFMRMIHGESEPQEEVERRVQRTLNIAEAYATSQTLREGSAATPMGEPVRPRATQQPATQTAGRKRGRLEERW